MDIDAEREKITKEIKELERILDPCSSSINVEVSDSSLESDSDADSLPDEDSDTAGPPISEEERWGEVSNDEDDAKEKTLPEDPETCLQLNMVYQEVIQEKLAEVGLLLAQNREQQEGVMWDLAGSKGPKVKDGKSLPPNLYIGHFMKPYFKDRVTGVGPPANEDARDKAAQGIKAFEALLVTKWKHWEKALLRKSVVSDRLQRLLQPKLLKLEYLQQKQSRVTSEAERQVLEKQSREAEKEIQEINQLPEEALLGSRLDAHDWEKISNVSFEGSRSAGEIQRFWQNWEHPSINKQEWSRQEVGQLKAIAAQHGHLEWQKIAEELGTGRSAFQCLQKLQQHSKASRRKEWTEQEDRMLTQLVQEMRVGSHIPYRKIVYYMEGRDSMQLIYRWTKSLDPSLKKGFWAPEEDAKLLRAVAKYGEQDWFKIRAEVPGRSDAQCRDRYLRRLHFSLKKGRWNPKEEEKLTELIEKHGVGHWAKIASELPHRSGSQCLSKWKIMVRKQQRRGRGRRRPLRTVRWSSSSGDSGSGDSAGDSSGSSSSGSSKEDSEPEPEPELEEAAEAQEGGQVLPSARHSVPDVDLWIPTRQSADRLWGRGAGGSATSSSPPAGFSVARGGSTAASAPTEKAGQAQAPSATHSAAGTDVGYPRSADTQPSSSEGPADESGVRLPKGPPETALQVLRTDTDTDTGCQPLEEERRQPCPGSAQGTGPGGSVLARPRVRQWPRGHALHRRPLERRLLMAVSPWVGDVLPCLPRRPAVVHTRADSIRTRLQDARLASTPAFALFIQLFQINTAGCMEVVRERKALLATLPQSGSQEPLQRPLQVPSSARSTTGCLSQNVPARKAVKSTLCRGSRGLQACWPEPTPQAPPPASCGPRPKPKTVSELLREKRLREARASKAAQGPAALPPQLLVSSPVVLQPALPLVSPSPPATGPAVSESTLSGPGAPTAAGPSTSGSWASAEDRGTPVLQALAFPPASTVAVKAPTAPAASRTPALGPSQLPMSCHLSGLGQSQAPATTRKQGLPEALPFLPAAPSPAQLPVQPLSLTPALGTHGGEARVAASTPLPVTWVLTTQGLLPVPVPAMAGISRPAETLDPKGLLVTLSPSLTETQEGQGLANIDVEPDPSSRTDLMTLSTPLPPQVPAAEVDGDMARAPKGHSSPGEAQAAGEIASKTALVADPPEAEPTRPSQLPTHGSAYPGSGPGGTLVSRSDPGKTRGPLDSERQPPPRLGPEKGALDLGLVSQESEVAVREWLQGQRGVCVPPLRSRLPYQPPALCSLRALAGLLLHKKALEHKAASLMPSGAARTPQASPGLLQGRLGDSPAYLLLKARFLAVFTLPALLATLPPRGVPTTLAAAARDHPEGDLEDLGELELSDGDGQPGCWTGGSPQDRPAASSPVQGVPDPGEGSAPSCLDESGDFDVLRTRHSRHARKRRRLV
ncbi:snRNA-activating protein complex subunit 4 [Pteropus alecto]|uniref:snRNA-activating protein complex subunit 4 n=1 Tax=Pteropus alecto TaxID=9402 RepID=UPI000768741D|nr:snRNA-activating protein complex subunit 4 [Pteropus alecto]XP_015449746.1 snRNA-activating protein complex subunit 4 [Pteropus alecto]XP_024907055.1 snRNA-activating protein complex subunit 4 [Pteropus alecto]